MRSAGGERGGQRTEGWRSVAVSCFRAAHRRAARGGQRVHIAVLALQLAVVIEVQEHRGAVAVASRRLPAITNIVPPPVVAAERLHLRQVLRRALRGLLRASRRHKGGRRRDEGPLRHPNRRLRWAEKLPSSPHHRRRQAPCEARGAIASEARRIDKNDRNMNRNSPLQSHFVPLMVCAD